jgi:hypothetical protein
MNADVFPTLPQFFQGGYPRIRIHDRLHFVLFVERILTSLLSSGAWMSSAPTHLQVAYPNLKPSFAVCVVLPHSSSSPALANPVVPYHLAKSRFLWLHRSFVVIYGRRHVESCQCQEKAKLWMRAGLHYFSKLSFVHESLLQKKTPRDWSRITQLELQLPMIPVGQRLHVNG